jgi:Peptidase propeptide and YPEB domain
MKRKTMIAAGAVAVAALGVAATGITMATAGNDDTDIPISGDALQRATAAALAHTGEGRVTETEVGDEESLYEIEVTLDDGSQVDVQLDERFEVVGSEADDDSGADDGGANDD